MKHVSVHECGRCGYDLTGLQRVGRCPECGHPFDLHRGLGVRPRMTTEMRGTRIARIIRTGILAALTLVFGGLAGLALMLGKPRPIPLLLLIVFILALSTLTSWVYHNDQT